MRRGALHFDQARSNLDPNSLANLEAPSGADRGPLIVKAASQFGCSCGLAGEVIATSSISCHSGCCLSSRSIRALNSRRFSFPSCISFRHHEWFRYFGGTTEAGSDAASINTRRCSASRAIASHVPRLKGSASPPGPNFHAQQQRQDYFCCSAGFSAGFGGLVWFCCGLPGELGFWSPEAEPGALVIVISFHKYLKNIFKVHFEAGA